METNEPLDDEISTLEITLESKSYLLETAKWGRFISLSGFIIIALIVILLIGEFFTKEFKNELEKAFHEGLLLRTILMLILLFFPFLFIHKFSKRIIHAVNLSSSIDLMDGFKNLKLLFRFCGIMMILMLLIFISFMISRSFVDPFSF